MLLPCARVECSQVWSDSSLRGMSFDVSSSVAATWLSMASAVEASYKQQGWHTGVKSAQAPIHAATARCQLVRAALKMQQCQGCVSQLNALEADDCAGRSCHVMPWYGAPKLSPCHGRVILSMCRTCALSCALLREECHCCHHIHKQQMVLPAIRLACLMSSQPSLLPVAMVG